MQSHVRGIADWSSAGLLFALTLLIGSGCDGPASPEPDPEPDELAEIRGTYNLVMFEGHPLPYHNWRTQVGMISETLELKLGDRYVKTRQRNYSESSDAVWEGVYLVRGDRVALVSDYGEAESYRLDEGILTSYRLVEGILTEGGTVYIREGTEIPLRYQYDVYWLESCDGRPPSYGNPCPGTVTASTLWLRGDDMYSVKDLGLEYPSTSYGRYEVDGDDVRLYDLSEGRDTGTLQGDTLTLGTWVYVRRD